MEGLLLTIALSIVVPLLILLLWFFLIFIVVPKCVSSKRQPSNNGDTLSCRLEECAMEITSESCCLDEPILNSQQRFSDVYDPETSSLAQHALQLPLYSTLPRNSARPFRGSSRDSSREHQETSSRHGYRLSPGNYSPFSQDTSLNQSETMQALSMYCDRYIADAHYEPPPPYKSRENIREHSQHTQTVSRRDDASHTVAYECETWI